MPAAAGQVLLAFVSIPSTELHLPFKRNAGVADLTGMDWVMTSAAVAVVWGAVRVFGNERQRRIEEIEAEAAAAEAALIAAAIPAPAIPEAAPAH